MHLCSNLCANVAFIVTKILQRPDIQGKWFNACIKLIKRLCMMSVVALYKKTMYDVGCGTTGPHVK